MGERQAVAVAEMLKASGPIDRLIASPLERAQQTAAAFSDPVETDARWIELSYGEYEGLPYGDLPSEVWQRWIHDFDYVPVGGESLSALDRRVREACDELVEPAARGNVVVVTHVSPMKSAVAWALDVGIGIAWNCHLDHASVCRINFRGRRPVLQTLNETIEVD